MNADPNVKESIPMIQLEVGIQGLLFFFFFFFYCDRHQSCPVQFSMYRQLWLCMV